MLELPKYTTEVQWSLCSEELIRSLGYIEYNPVPRGAAVGEQSKDLAKLDQLLR